VRANGKGEAGRTDTLPLYRQGITRRWPMATEQQPQQPQQQQQQQQQPQQPQQHTGALARAGAEEQGLRTTFSCVFEGFSREL